MKIRSLAIAAIVGAGLCAMAQPGVAGWVVAALPVPVIVELFTSEGCSSCPPADQVLGDLVRTQPVEGALIVGLGEHVDYWDHQGWRDPFSDKLFSLRQSAYAAARASGEVYTPQMIVDGTRVIVAQDRSGAVDAIRRSAAAAKTPVHLTWTDGPSSSLDIETEAGKAGAGAQVFLAVTEDALSSSVTAGENTGRHLTHAAVVRQLRDIGRTDSSGAFHKAMPIKLDASWRRSALRAVVFIQRRPLGAITAVGTSTIRLP
jgi:hypothetical protein